MKQSNVKQYFKPKTLAEALEALKNAEGKTLVVAGATDVFCKDDLELDALIDITGLGLDTICEENDLIKIGACATFHDIIGSELLQHKFAALCESAKVLADHTIRNLATYGGNICTALPSGDAIPSVYAADADLVLVSASGTRTVKAEDFFTGPRKTVLQKGELLTQIVLKPLCSCCKKGSAFEKIARNSVDLAISNVAAGIELAEDGTVTALRVALGAVGPTVMRAKKFEQSIIGKKVTRELLDAAAEVIPEEISPITNIRGTQEYRSDVSIALVKKAVLRAYEAATK